MTDQIAVIPVVGSEIRWSNLQARGASAHHW